MNLPVSGITVTALYADVQSLLTSIGLVVPRLQKYPVDNSANEPREGLTDVYPEVAQK